MNISKIDLPSPALSRRALLKRSIALSAGMVAGTGFLASSNAAWAMEVKSLKPETMATLVQMARDIYPHDRFSDDLYATAIKGHDERSSEDDKYKTMIEEGVASLDAMAIKGGHDSYLATGWEVDRLAILKSMQSEEFFQSVRGGLVTGLYNQPAVWELLGYEGASFEKGGYISRGFDDINWL